MRVDYATNYRLSAAMKGMRKFYSLASNVFWSKTGNEMLENSLSTLALEAG